MPRVYLTPQGLREARYQGVDGARFVLWDAWGVRLAERGTVMNDTPRGPGKWKQMIIHEMIEYGINFAYLAFFLIAFVWYRRLVLAAYHIEYTNYWFPVIEAAVLAKVIMVGDILRLGRRLEERSLILPTLYRTLVFTVWVGVFFLLEATVRGLLRGGGLIAGYADIASKGPYEILSWCVVVFVVFIPFFGFKELGRVLGEEKLRALFFRRETRAAGAT